MALADPVPGAELFIEHEPGDGEPIAQGETDASGSFVVTLEKGRYSVKLRLRERVCRRRGLG